MTRRLDPCSSTPPENAQGVVDQRAGRLFDPGRQPASRSAPRCAPPCRPPRTRARPARAPHGGPARSDRSRPAPALRAARPGRRGSASSPVSPSATSSGIPDSRVATTGTPAASASMSATGTPSICPLPRDHAGQHEQVRPVSRSRTASSRMVPWNRTRSAMPSSRALRSSSARSGPPPTRSSSHALELAASRPARRAAPAWPLYSWRLATHSARTGPSGGTARGLNRSADVSMPLWIDMDVRDVAVARQEAAVVI